MTTPRTTPNNGLIGGMALSVVCFVLGAWYFQSSLVELRTLVVHQQLNIVEQRREILEQTAKVAEQGEIIRQLKEKLGEQNKDSNENNIKDSGHRVARATTTQLPQSCPLIVGPKGDPGPRGYPGAHGSIGENGQKGEPGPHGDYAGGVVYVRWGHKSCPPTGAELVYHGRVGGSHWDHSGGGTNPQCLPLEPNYYRTINGAQKLAFMFGAQYQYTSSLESGSSGTDVVCAVCYVPTRSTVYMLPAMYTCPTGWTREYFGYLMSTHYDHHRSQYTCIDHSLTSAPDSRQNRSRFLLYTVEIMCGSLPCPPYDRNKELSCGVCTR